MENQEITKNKSKLPLIIISIIGIVLLVGGVALALLPDEKKEETPPPTEKPEEEHYGEKEVNDINQIILYGIEIFKSGDYKKLPKKGEKYFITLDELKQKGYDVSKLVKNCEGDNAIIFFEDKEMDPVTGYPIYVIYDCSKHTENPNPPKHDNPNKNNAENNNNEENKQQPQE